MIAFPDAESFRVALPRLTFDLVVSDVGLPGASGLELARWLRDRYGDDLPVLLLSGREDEETIVGGLTAGAVDYLLKPSSPALLRAKAGLLLRDRAPLPDLTALPVPGTSFGPYQLERVLGRGTYGVVYQALDALGEPIALKLLSPHVGEEPEWAARWHREVEILRAAELPHVVRYRQAGRIRGVHFLAMELIVGRSAEDLARAGELTPLDVLSLGEQVATAIGALDRAGLVHRDVKPANILLATDGAATLVDFGLARGAEDTSLTATQEILGTPGFIAPELIRGERREWVGSDLYSLGATLYHLLTGEPPFRRSNWLACLKATAGALQAPRISDRDPTVSAELDELVAELLEPDAEWRPRDAFRIAQRLREIRDRDLARQL